MSSYDDPRWYEQPESFNTHPQTPSNNFRPPMVPEQEAFTPRQATRQQYIPDPEPGRRRIFGQFVVIAVLLVIAFLAGWFSHQTIADSFNPNNQSQSYVHLIQQAWGIIDQNYVDRKAVNYKQMSYAAISAMLAVLHDKGHTYFLTPEQLQSENQQLSGTFVGVGMGITQDPVTKQFVITSILPGSPAEKAGFRRNDIITAVNGKSVAGMSEDTVHNLIHNGGAGSSAIITIQRPSTKQTLTLKVTRDVIQAENVILHYIAQDHIAHIQIVQFADGVSDELKTALTQAKKDGATRIILDLRDNPGGYLDQAVNTASEFVGKGNVLLEQDSSGNRTPDPVRGSPVNTTSPIVVLVNGNTASAAEIVSGALQDNNRAVILGTQTLGTGTVLTQFPLDDHSAIFLGTSEWLTPKGKFIRDHGITPDITVTLNSNVSSLTPSQENQSNLTEQQILKSGDTQLVKAIQYLETQNANTLPAGSSPNATAVPAGALHSSQFTMLDVAGRDDLC